MNNYMKPFTWPPLHCQVWVSWPPCMKARAHRPPGWTSPVHKMLIIFNILLYIKKIVAVISSSFLLLFIPWYDWHLDSTGGPPVHICLSRALKKLQQLEVILWNVQLSCLPSPGRPSLQGWHDMTGVHLTVLPPCDVSLGAAPLCHTVEGVAPACWDTARQALGWMVDEAHLEIYSLV